MHVDFHRSPEDLAADIEHVAAAPRDAGRVELLVVRPAEDERVEVDEVVIDTEVGLVGDTWPQRGSTRTPDGGPDPDAQVTVMCSRASQLVAGARERWSLAGDQVYVDLDLSVDNLPTGTRLALGDAILEVTAAPHTGCSKFSERFGVDALRLTATPEGRRLRLRGINTRVVRSGTVRVGDEVLVTRP
jgi:MOSC domain-containing protein YiiM